MSPVQFELPSEIWYCWHRFCLVQGTLLKSIVTGGLPVDLPVCGAEVQIWEVEPIEFILPKLPISIIEKLRQIVLNPVLAYPVNPNPPDPAPFQALDARVQMAKPMPTISAAPTGSAEFASLQILAQTSNAEEFRGSLIQYIPIIRYWLCELIPLFVTKTLIATTTTDRCGNFEERIFRSCYASNPNLYFTASLNFGFISFPIYDPTPVACYTYWNYQCGTNVTLYTNSIFAPGCSPCAPVNAGENYVLFRAIGGISLSSIYGASPLLPATPTGEAAGAVVAGEDSCFGGTLLPRVEFDSSLLEDGLASYYQISYWDYSLLQWVVLKRRHQSSLQRIRRHATGDQGLSPGSGDGGNQDQHVCHPAGIAAGRRLGVSLPGLRPGQRAVPDYRIALPNCDAGWEELTAWPS